jgi:hypothetical protein
MKLLEVNINGNVIEAHNHMMTGKESVYYNGTLMAEKASLGGHVHQFEVIEDGEEVLYEIVYKFNLSIQIEIYRNKEFVAARG